LVLAFSVGVSAELPDDCSVAFAVSEVPWFPEVEDCPARRDMPPDRRNAAIATRNFIASPYLYPGLDCRLVFLRGS
jgi:hypothetical protein